MTGVLCVILCFMGAVILARLRVIDDQVDEIELAQRKNATNTSADIDRLKSAHDRFDARFTRLDNSINRIECNLAMIRTTNLTFDDWQVVSQFVQVHNQYSQAKQRITELEAENALLKERVQYLTNELSRNKRLSRDELEL